jgi:hypothetical protein
MFIRWKQTARKPLADGTKRYRLSCQIVEAYRDEAGKPRQRMVAHLGTVRKEHLRPKEHDGWVQVFWFCVNVSRKLRKLEVPAKDAIEYKTKIGARLRHPMEKGRARMRDFCEATYNEQSLADTEYFDVM